MIDPINITEYGASKARLEEIALFSLLAASNNAMVAAKGLDKLLRSLRLAIGDTQSSPFGLIYSWLRSLPGFELYVFTKPFNHLPASCFHPMAIELRACGIGKFKRKARGVVELANYGLNLRTCTHKELEKVYNIGPKTSRFFILHTREEANHWSYVALDTHILHYMRDQGYNVPKSTPPPNLYEKIAKQFFELAKKSGKTLAEFDLEIWNEYAGYKKRMQAFV